MEKVDFVYWFWYVGVPTFVTIALALVTALVTVLKWGFSLLAKRIATISVEFLSRSEILGNKIEELSNVLNKSHEMSLEETHYLKERYKVLEEKTNNTNKKVNTIEIKLDRHIELHK